MRLAITLWVLVLASACSSVPVIDNSARMQAAVRIEKVRLTGGQGYFAYAGKQTTWTHAQQRRIQQQVDFTASALGAFGAGAERAYLFDLRTPSLKHIDYDAKLYHSCDLLGCFEYSQASRSVEPQPPVLDGEACGATVESSQIKFEPAPEQVPVDGREPYYFAWNVSLRDPQQRTGISRLHGVVWLGADEAPAATAVESDFQSEYYKATGQTWPPLERIVPWVPLALVEEYFLSTLAPEQRARALPDKQPLFGVGASVVVAGQLQWETRGDACSNSAPEKKQSVRQAADGSADDAQKPAPQGDGIETINDFMAAIGKELGGEKTASVVSAPNEKQDVPQKPADQNVIFVYEWDVRTHTVGEVTANQLRVPDNYRPGTRF